MEEYKVSLRGGFSDRMGIKPINTEMQIEDLDKRTRISLSNLLDGLYHYSFEHDFNGSDMRSFHLQVLSEVYQKTVDYSGSGCVFRGKETIEILKNTILEDDYDSALTIIEYVAAYLHEINTEKYRDIDVYECFNNVFEREYVGYRFLHGKIVCITSEEEITEIETALGIPLDNVHKHLEKALGFLSRRENPDYENSIKESISAVEAMCSDILGHKGTLGDALKELKKDSTYHLHPALEGAFSKLYGYAGDDSSGIRHAAGLGGEDSTFAEARYMLVSCSAFVNYLLVSTAGSFGEKEAETEDT